MVSGARCWGRYETWPGGAAVAAGAGSGDGQRCAAAGETLSGLQLAGAALIMAGLYINVFGLRLVRLAWRAGKKAPEAGLYKVCV